MRDAADSTRRSTWKPSHLDLPGGHDAEEEGDGDSLDELPPSPSPVTGPLRSVSFHSAMTPQSLARFSVLPAPEISLDGVGPTERTAESVLISLIPHHSAAVKARLQRENIVMASDLARLDKDDLRELGLSMVERGKVLAWGRQAFPLAVSDSNRSRWSMLESIPDQAPGTPSSLVNKRTSDMSPIMVRHTSDAGACSTNLTRLLESKKERAARDFKQEQHEVASSADFWCRLAMDSGTSYLRADVEQVEELLRRGGEVNLGDLRENVLEKLFDLSTERVKEIYESIDKDSDGRILKEELQEGLHRCELHGLDGALEKVLAFVSSDRGTLELTEFESVLSRLKLAQLLSAPKLQHQSAAELLSVIDYNSHRVEERKMSLKEFFFGRRNDVYPMRWVHLRRFDLTLMLALTVKYQLHPLSVEDVIDQAPTKIDHYEGHYFVSIEHLEAVGQPTGLQPVQIRGRHVTVFCAGAPLSDTVLTVSQSDRSFQEDWPGLSGQMKGINSHEDNWVSRLQKRIKAVRSRTRERRADFLMYEIVDLCTDDLRLVTRSYTARLNFLEDRLQRGLLLTESEKLEWFNEVGLVRLQLAVLSRRLRGLQRILRRLSEDPDISPALSGYLQDVGDHVNEAYEDAGHLGEKCSSLSAGYEHAEDKIQEKLYQENAKAQSLQDDRMNRMLFILTILSTVFTPLTFLCGIYGMNFQDMNGHPTIPELLLPDGYLYFMIFTAVYLVISCVVGVWLWKRVKRTKNHSVSRTANPRTQPTWGQQTPVNSNYAAMH